MVYVDALFRMNLVRMDLGSGGPYV